MNDSNHTWRIIGETVRGASHTRAELPNQDAIDWTKDETDLPLILCLSDGHGSARYFRSDTGSRLAVDTAVEVIKEFLSGQSDINDLSLIERRAKDELRQDLARRWREGVLSHVAAHPFTTLEMVLLSGKERANEGESESPLIEIEDATAIVAYGATLLCAVLTADYILYLQLGDGDILTVSDKGEITKPLATDERLFANETTSLCSPHAWSDFRVGFQVMSDAPPALILLSTDGYANSFRDEAGFLKVGSDLLNIIRADGLESVSNNLKAWLADTSQAGSGDDITVGLICNMDALEQVENQSQSAAGVASSAETVAAADTATANGESSMNEATAVAGPDTVSEPTEESERRTRQ